MLVIFDFLVTKIKLELVACDAAIHAHAETVASKHIGDMHSCAILVMENIAWGRGGEGGGFAKVLRYLTKTQCVCWACT
jgi:hypothetical protein